MGTDGDGVNERFLALEGRVLALEVRSSAGAGPDYAGIRANVQDFLLTACDTVAEVDQATWAMDLYAWYSAWCVLKKHVVPSHGIVFIRTLNTFKVSRRKRSVRNRDMMRDGVVYMLAPLVELRHLGADFVTECTPPPDQRAGGPHVFKNIRKYAERVLEVQR